MTTRKKILVSAGCLSLAGLMLAGGIRVSAQNVYPDVPAGYWAFDAVQWVSGANIMTGPGDASGLFDIGGVVNRAQLAATLYRYNRELVTDINDLQVRVNLLERRLNELEGDRSSSSSWSSRSSSSAMTSSSSSSLSSSSSSSSLSSLSSSLSSSPNSSSSSL